MLKLISFTSTAWRGCDESNANDIKKTNNA